jgi:hypothetical protein
VNGAGAAVNDGMALAARPFDLKLGKLGMDRFVFALHYDFPPVRIRDKALTSNLMSLYVIAQDHMGALEHLWPRKTIATKPIGTHVCGYAHQLQFGQTRSDLFNHGARKLNVIDVHTDQYADTHPAELIHRVLLKITTSFCSTVTLDLQVIDSVLSSM